MSKKAVMTISQYNYDKIGKLEGATWNDKIRTLFSIVEPYMPYIEYTEKNKSVKVETSTREYIDSFKITIGESRDNILTRAFMILDEINNTSSEDYWIPFKITNRYNKSLVIDGQIEYNSKELSFNYRGNVFRGKLPPSYIVEGNDLTKELYLWHDNLDWDKIVKLIIENYNMDFVKETDNYVLIINSI